MPGSDLKKGMLKIINEKYPEYVSKEIIISKNKKFIESTNPSEFLNAVLVSKVLDQEFKLPAFFEAPSGLLFENFDLDVHILIRLQLKLNK